MSLITTKNICVHDGIQSSFIFDVKDAGSAVNLTGYTVTAEVRDDADTIVQALTPTVTDAANGEVTLTITRAQAITIAAAGKENLVWDMLVIDGSSIVTKAVQGVVNVYQTVTQAIT